MHSSDGRVSRGSVHCLGATFTWPTHLTRRPPPAALWCAPGPGAPVQWRVAGTFIYTQIHTNTHKYTHTHTRTHTRTLTRYTHASAGPCKRSPAAGLSRHACLEPSGPHLDSPPATYHTPPAHLRPAPHYYPAPPRTLLCCVHTRSTAALSTSAGADTGCQVMTTALCCPPPSCLPPACSLQALPPASPCGAKPATAAPRSCMARPRRRRRRRLPTARAAPAARPIHPPAALCSSARRWASHWCVTAATAAPVATGATG